MRTNSWRARTQGSRPSLGRATFLGALALSAVLGAAGCTPPHLVAPDDGGKKDAKGSDANTCSSSTVSQSKGQGDSCSCDRECRTGFCVDSICCDKACKETCKACNVADSLGTCSFVPAGVQRSECPASTKATCGPDGTCDGQGGCTKHYAKATVCKAGTCEGDNVTGILTCDGNGNCSEPTSTACPPYTCDPANSRCFFPCTTDAQCVQGQQCVGGRCGESPNGALCQTDSDCYSGHCARAGVGDPVQAGYGVCCKYACSDPCESCNQTGLWGICTLIPASLPDPACIASDRSTCGFTGSCDGFGGCSLFPENTECGSSSCSGVFKNLPLTCDGMGNCGQPGVLDCTPSNCANGECVSSCKNSDTDCAPGNLCTPQTTSGVTTSSCGKGQPGQPCKDSSSCASGQCVDGVCCENACAGACQSCNLPSSPGRCLNVAANAPDPHKNCKDQGAASCSTNGKCDGTGTCQTYPVGQVCGTETCTAGSYSPPPTCNASSQCTPSPSRPCNPYVCNGTACYTSPCTNNTQCVNGNVCSGAPPSCGLQPLGASCSLAKECVSGFCAQGVCCESACGDACMACNLLATAGLCVDVPDNSPDPQGKCIATTQTNPCGITGKCVGGACAKTAKGNICKAASCSSAASQTPGSQCDGQGNCVTPADIECTPSACVNNACKNSCTVATQATDCKPPNTCVNNQCGLKLLGAACTAASQCQSGFCTEGVCCNNACSDGTSGLCKTCKGTSTSAAGTCSNVDKGGSDPKSGCTKSDLSKGDCSNAGTCDGAGACQRQPNSAGCRQDSCTAGVHTLADTCNGGTQCPAVQTAKCDPFVCGSTTCLTTCKSNSDCNGVTCNMTTNNCGDKLADGSKCSIDTDCTNGHCIGGICCHSACNACQTCSATGTCANIKAGSASRTSCGTTAASGACGYNGTCDGNGKCAQNATCNASFTTCKDANTQYNNTGNCDYSGSTPACDLVAYDCGAYVCSGKACKTTCATDADCDTASGYYCMGTGCRTLNAGEACSGSRKCSGSLTCVDGVCCSAASCNDCYSCNVTGKAGSCNPVAANTTDGACVPSCNATTNTATSAYCDGAGKCVTKTTTCTGGSTCSGGVCGNACSATNPCPANYTCSNATCKLSNGQACSGANGALCSSGNCVDGYCCDTATSCGVCKSCGVTGHLGTCYNSDGASCDDGDKCTTGDKCTGGVCGGTAITCPSGICLSGACTACTPRSTQCSDNKSYQTCSSTGAWGTALSCSPGTCVSGACTACTAGSTQCSDNKSYQTCSSTGAWGAAVACTNQACVNGACTGVCSPSSTQCSDASDFQTCSSTGTWGDPAACASDQTCSGGVCS